MILSRSLPRQWSVSSSWFSSRVRSPGLISRFSTEAASHHANKVQVYISRSHNPLLNLSFEHHLLQTTPPESTILLLYVNAPCVVFGRNQNPWLETNLSQLARLAKTDAPVQLVRRRSGGGTVFHDLGNVNFSVICPPAAFDRDKHAEMVVRALRSRGKPNVRVNERHDIVLDVEDEFTRGPRGAEDYPATGTFKISGSAYKLTRLRSLHHGTCLLRSPNLGSISSMLRSPAEGLIKARGVDSVRSPVRNVDLDNEEFQAAVLAEFETMYGKADIQQEILDDEALLAIDKLRSGYDEMRSRDWLYGQTPRFTLCTHPTEEDARPRADLPFNHYLRLDARQGVIERFQFGQDAQSAQDIAQLADTRIWQVQDWTAQLRNTGVLKNNAEELGTWLNEMLGTEFTSLSTQSSV